MVTTSWAWPKSWLVRVIRPDACRRARSSRSWSSLSSKSSRSSVAACSIRRTLVAMENLSESRESSSDTSRPSRSESTASPNSASRSQSRRSSRPLRYQSRNAWGAPRSEEHTSELQSLAYLVCRLLLEKKKKKQKEVNNIKKQEERSKGQRATLTCFLSEQRWSNCATEARTGCLVSGGRRG